jgi:anti-anti-sigma factor
VFRREIRQVRQPKKARYEEMWALRFGKMKRSAQLTIEEKVEGQDRVLSLRGSADILSMPTMQDLLNRYRKEKIRLVVIDLSATEFINSPVWAVITLYARKKSDESRLAIVGMSERIKGSFEMMGLHRELQTYDSAKLARAELGLQAEG